MGKLPRNCCGMQTAALRWTFISRPVTKERRAAQELAFDDLMGTNTRFSKLSGKRTLPNPRGPQKEKVKQLIN